MAFNTSNGSGSGRGNNNSAANNASEDPSWKAHGFLNIYVTNKAGGRAKLGSIALKKSNARELQLSQWLAGDDENNTRMNQLLKACLFEFNIADTGDASHFDLPFDQSASAEAA